MLGQWQAKDFAADAGASAVLADKDGWVAVEAPGDIYVALHRAGRITDPFADGGEQAAAWVIDRTWWWRTAFDAPRLTAGENAVLTFEGLDTFAEVWLNGEKIGATDNMFVPLRLDVTARLKPSNTLLVKFTPPAAAVADKAPLQWRAGMAPDAISRTKRNLIRKAQFGWGWDWGPTLPTIGIWKPVTLAVEKPAMLDDVRFTTVSLGNNSATVRVDASARGKSGGTRIDAVLTAPDGKTETLAISKDTTLASPQLWWTHDLGTPALYDLTVTLRDGDSVLDRRAMKVGIRTIALDQSPDPDEPGATFFRFVLNGVPIFARGACWIPASSFVGALVEKDYRWLIEDAAAGNMNMLRIWGGGIYEHEAFYDLCDHHGVLVWQDFMFACAPYPEKDPAFVASVDAEVRSQIVRLRHHASLALWCGNNENQVIHAMVAGREAPLAGDYYYEHSMPKAVAELDPATPYWPGSPYGGPHPGSMRAGDVHDWTVWHGIPPIPDGELVGKLDRSPTGIAYTRYAEDMGRFISEYGIHASPALETLKRALPKEQLYYKSPGMENRIKDNPKDKVNAMLSTVTGIPEDLQQYVDFTQILQAEGLKFGIEHFRRRMPHCSGSLIWQYNDCWPCVSWSMVDYNGFAKASYFYVKRAYAPVMASFKRTGDGGAELWLTNETRDAVSDTAEITLGMFGGDTVWREKATVRVPANTSACIWRADAAKIGAAADRYLHVAASGGAFAANRTFFAEYKDLKRPRPAAPKMSIAQNGPHELAVTLTAPDYVYFAHLLVPHATTRFSDNYFDMVPGETRTVIVRNKDVALSADDVTVRSG